MTPSARGKTVLLTGATSGLGLELAYQLARQAPSHVLFAVRNTSRGEEVRKVILEQEGNGDLHIQVLELDLESYDSVIRFVEELGKKVSAVDIAILNAGVGVGSAEQCKETGHEVLAQVNYLSNALLTLLLLPFLRKSYNLTGTPARLTIVTTALFVISNPDLSKYPATASPSTLAYLNNPSNFKYLSRYTETKLLMTLWLKHLATKVNPKEMILNTTNPGAVRGTNLERDLPFYFRPIVRALKAVLAISVKEGAGHTLFSVLEAGEDTVGELVNKRKNTKYGNDEVARGVAEKLWRELEEEFAKKGVNVTDYLK